MNQLKVFHEIMSRRLLKRRCGKELRQIFQYRIEQKNSLGAFHRGLRFTVFGTNGKRNDVVTNEKHFADKILLHQKGWLKIGKKHYLCLPIWYSTVNNFKKRCTSRILMYFTTVSMTWMQTLTLNGFVESLLAIRQSVIVNFT